MRFEMTHKQITELKNDMRITQGIHTTPGEWRDYVMGIMDGLNYAGVSRDQMEEIDTYADELAHKNY